MNTAVINIKTDPKVKAKAQKIASQLGLSLSAVINGYLNQFVRTKSLNLSLDKKEYEYSDYFVKSMKESEADYKAGRYISFDNVDDTVKYLDKMIVESEN